MSKKAENLLREYIDFKDVNGSGTIQILPLTIVDIMLEFAEIKNSKSKKFFRDWIFHLESENRRLSECCKNLIGISNDQELEEYLNEEEY